MGLCLDMRIASASESSFVIEESLASDSLVSDIICSSSLATPDIVIVLSGLVTLKLTSSAHVYVRGKSLVSISANVRVSRSLSAFSTISATSAT